MSLVNVSKSYGTVKIIEDITFRIEDNSFIVFVGPSGCGKSTLLRMVAGLEPITGGSILIDDVVVNAVAPKNRDIAMVFQNYALYPHMTVKENLSFSLKLRGLPKEEVERNILHASGILGIYKLLDRYPRQLSGGQKQRVAMGRAIVRNPKVFLFDEPLSNLDAKLRVQMRADIKDIQRRLNTTTLYVTHDQVEAMTMADKVVVLRDGAVEQIGSPLEIYERPRNRFVAEFIGSPQMNVLPGNLVSSGVEVAGGMVLPAHLVSPEPGRKVHYGFRPEHIEIAESPVRITVKTVENTGTDSVIVGVLDDQVITLLSRARLGARPGDVLPIRIAADNAHVFDQADGLRIQNIPSRTAA